MEIINNIWGRRKCSNNNSKYIFKMSNSLLLKNKWLIDQQGVWPSLKFSHLLQLIDLIHKNNNLKFNNNNNNRNASINMNKKSWKKKINWIKIKNFKINNKFNIIWI